MVESLLSVSALLGLAVVPVCFAGAYLAAYLVMPSIRRNAKNAMTPAALF